MTGRLDFEHRTSPRVSLFQEIVCEGAEASMCSQVADLSVGGMFIDHPSPPFPAPDLITVRFSLAPQEAPIVAVYGDGRVVLGPGKTLGQVLKALEVARDAVLGIQLVKE